MPTRKDKTNVAPIYREQVFIPASGHTKFMQEFRKRNPRGGNLEIVSPEFDLLTGIRGIATLKNLPINITSKNAHKIKDKDWDKLYNAAIDKGDVEEIKRLRDLHFQAKSRNNFIINEDGTPKHLYHATKNKFNSFDLNKAGTGSGNLSNTEGVVYFSPYKEASLDVFRPKKSEVKDFNIMDLYVNNTNPVNVRLSDFIKTWNNKEEFLKLRNAGEGIIAKGIKTPQQYYDEAVKKYLEKEKSGTLSIFDRKPESVKEFMEEQLVDNYTINNPNNIKSAKAITYDNNGNLIPLSKRDNFNINDIRMKCGGRRKAQLGLDIREGGIAIPIANNMFYINGRKHAAGGVAIGPNNKNGVEVEGGEVVEMIDSNHPSVGRQFKAGGQQQTMRVFSSVPFLRGDSPAQLVMEGANPDTVFKAQEEFKDRNRINDDGTTYEMGGEGKPKSKRSRPVTGVLPYGYTIRNLYSVENPYRKGIKGNVVKMYDSRTLGAGVDVVSGHPELYKKAKSGRITKKQADETAVIHLRKDDNAIRSNYADVYGKAAADTLSYGPRFLVAQARYQQGNVRKAWRPIHKAMAKGDAKALKKAVLQVTPKDHEYRRKWIEDFKVYKMGGMIYEINGNVRNGLMSARPKAQYGLASKYLKKRNKTTENLVEIKQNDEPNILDIRNTAGYKVKQVVENPWVKYPVEVASYLLSGATAKGINLIGTVGKKAAKEVVNKTDDVVFKFGKTRKNKEDIILNTVDEIGISNRFTKPVETTISYKPQTRFRDGKTYVVKEKTIKKVAEKRFTPKKEVIDKNITTYTPPKNNTGNTINFEDAIIIRKQMDHKTSRELDKVYRKAVGNKEPKSGFGRVPQQTTIEYTPKGESINAYDASVEFHKRVSDMLYDSYVKKYGKKGVDKAMKREHISKYEYGGRIKAEGGKFLKYKNGVFTDPESGEEYDVDPEVFKMYGNSFEEGVIPLDDRQYRGKLRIITNPRNQKTGDSYIINPLTGEWIRNGVTETSEPSVKGTTKVTSKSSSTARGRGTKTSASKAVTKTTTKGADVKYGTPLKEKKESLYMTGIKNNSITPLRAGMEKSKSPSSTGGGTQSKDDPWIPQYNTITGRDWLGVGTNLAGHIANYFANNALLKKAPMPIKPVQFQAAKLRTTHNINPELANINEVTQMNLAEVGRNTASSNTSIGRKQRIMNEARDARNKLYGQKENIETQLINLDRRNRQDVYNRNIAAYNDWLDKTYVAKSNNLLNKQRNLTNLISGIPMAVNTMLGTIENRKSTNDMIRAIAAANPNVDGRLLGIGDYYTQKQSNGRTAVYNKNHKLVKYV